MIIPEELNVDCDMDIDSEMELQKYMEIADVMVCMEWGIEIEEEIKNGNSKEISVSKILKDTSLEAAQFDFDVASK